MNYSFGAWIKRRRKALDLTQEELALKVGCSASAIFKIESDERRPSRQIAELLATQLEVPVEQHALFLKIARQEKVADYLDGIPQPGNYSSPPSPLTKHNNLPVFPTPFVGREHELEIIVLQLLNPACRLMTLTGPGGIGKTRLAVEVARRMENEYPDGVFFLPMAGVGLPESILPTLADSLGMAFSGPAEPRQQVIEYLREKKLLLLLDTMEHLIAGSELLAEILQKAAHVKMLLTSLEPVHLQWEWVFEVQGLPVPEEIPSIGLEGNSAIALFLHRAQQAAQDFDIAAEDPAALVQICRAVDGLPLAIELAASWVRIMNLAEIAAELERSLDLLETSLQDVPARHRSIKNVFAHSWTLLTEQEQSVLMRLSVFPNGFTREAAQTVTGASLSVLSSMVSKSLLRYNKKNERYDLHELIRQYTLGQLQKFSVENGQYRKNHSRYYSDWLANQEASLKSDQQVQTSALIRGETANWISAWRWGVQNQDYPLLRKMIPCLYWYFEIHGYYAEALNLYRYALEELRSGGGPDNIIDGGDISTFAFIVNQSGWFAFRTGNIEQATPAFTESLELARQYPDPEVLYHIHGNWGYQELLKGNIQEAEQLTLACLANAQELASLWHIAIPVNVLGLIELQRGNFTHAHQKLTDGLQAWRPVGDLRGLIFSMLYLSTANLALGQVEEAETLLHESNAIAIQKSDRWAQAFGLDLMGQAALARGQSQQARDYFSDSLKLSQEIGDQWGETQTLIHLARAQTALGHPHDAYHLFKQAYQNSRQAKWIPTLLEVLAAGLAAEDQIPFESRMAAILAVLAHPALTPPVRQQAEQLRHRLEAGLSPQQIESAAHIAGNKGPEIWAEEIFESLARDYPSG